MIWPTLGMYTRKTHRSSELTLYAFDAACDFDGYGNVLIGISGGAPSLEHVYEEIIRELDLLRNSLPRILSSLAEPSAWSFRELHGINVTPEDVVRRPVELGVSLTLDGLTICSRSMSIQCHIDDSHDVEPNNFFVVLDAAGNVEVSQLND